MKKVITNQPLSLQVKDSHTPTATPVFFGILFYVLLAVISYSLFNSFGL